MSQLNDAILAATGGPSVNDGLVTHYQANGATSGDLGTAEYQFLVANGATPAHRQDMWYQLLPPVVGFVGQLNDMLLPFWLAGGTFAPPDSPLFNANPVGVDPWPSSFEAFEEAGYQFDARPYFADGGFISQWSLSGDVPTWLRISNTGVLTGTPPFDDRDYGNITVTGNNSTGPAANATPIPMNTPENVRINFNPLNQVCEIGSQITYAVNATIGAGGSLTYQWYKNGSPIPSATSFAYNPPAAVKASNGDSYFCRVTGEGGVFKDSTVAALRTMQTFNNNADGSGQLDRTIQIDPDNYVLSVKGTGLVEVRGDVTEN